MPIATENLPEVLPRVFLEQMIVERTIVDAQFRTDLLENPVSALSDFFGTPLPEGFQVYVYVEDAYSYYYTTPNTEPEVGAFSTILGASPASISARENFSARLNYLLSNTSGQYEPADVDSLKAQMDAAEQVSEQAADEARDAEMQAARSAQALEDANIHAVATAALAEQYPDSADLSEAASTAQLDAQEAEQTALADADTASSLRFSAMTAADAADTVEDNYEDALRTAFQQDFANDAVNALNTYLNVEVPFTSFEVIRDTDLLEDEPAVSDGMATEGIRLIHLIETSGQALFLVLPYAPNRSLMMGPYSVSFNGLNSYIQIPRSRSLTAQEYLTVEVWFQVPEFRENEQDVLISTLTDDGGWQIEVGGGIPKLTMTLDEVAYVLQADRPLLSVGEWHYLAGVLNGDTILLYANGRFCAQTHIAGDGELVPGNSDLFIGRTASALADSDTAYFQGLIHEVRLWGDALTNSELVTNVPIRREDDDPSETPLETLLAHYVFGEGTGTMAIDSSSNHNDGEIVEASWQITGLASPA